MDLIKLSQEQLDRFEPSEYDELQRNAWLLRTGDGADCLVSCGGSTVQLHREIICRRSRYFRAGLAGGFMEGHSMVLVLQEVVSPTMVFRIIQYMYLSNSKVDHGLDVVYGPMNDVEFYEMALELYRHADYLKVEGLKVAIMKDLRKRLDMSTKILFRQHWQASNPVWFKQAMQDPMAGAVSAFDKAKKYYIFYEPIRSEFLNFVERCYPVLSGMGDDFEDYLHQAPDLGLTILKNMSHIKKSTFIVPGPQVRCTFCNELIYDVSPRRRLYRQPEFGIIADCNGNVKYFCNSSKCFGKIRVNSSFKGK